MSCSICNPFYSLKKALFLRDYTLFLVEFVKKHLVFCDSRVIYRADLGGGVGGCQIHQVFIGGLGVSVSAILKS